MKIDIDTLTEAELTDLNHRIVERLRRLNRTRAHKAMLELSLGERVCFQPDGRALLFGIVTRYNTKTVTVITENGEHWNVAPAALRRGSDVVAPTEPTNVIQLHTASPRLR
jgi:hypothetical protein